MYLCQISSGKFYSMKRKDTVGKAGMPPSEENETDLAIKDGKLEVSYVHLYERLMDMNSPLTPIERMLLAAMVKRVSISPVVIPAIAFAADMYIDMEKKQGLEKF
jgi:hypothetical protein